MLGSALVLGCSSDDDDMATEAAPAGPRRSQEATQKRRRAVESTIRGAVDAYTAANTDQFLNYWTDEGLMNEFGASSDRDSCSRRRVLRRAAHRARRVQGRSTYRMTMRDSGVRVRIRHCAPATTIQPRPGRDVLEDQRHESHGRRDSRATRLEIDMDLDEFSFEFDTSGVKTNVAFSAGQRRRSASRGSALEGTCRVHGSTSSCRRTRRMRRLAGVEIVGFAGPVRGRRRRHDGVRRPTSGWNVHVRLFHPGHRGPGGDAARRQGHGDNVQRYAVSRERRASCQDGRHCMRRTVA